MTLQKQPKLPIARGRKLRPDSTVGVIAPGSAVAKEKFESGLSALRARGFQVVVPHDPTNNFGRADRGFGSGEAAVRVAALHTMLRDPAVDVILTARGGYGTSQILPLVDFDLIRNSKKIIVGYSDITALLANIATRSGLVSVHGAFVGGEFAREHEDHGARASVESLLRLLSDETYRPELRGESLRNGEDTGWLLAGNLTMFQTLLGTPWDISFDGAVLLLEEITELPYRVHRALLQLFYAGKFKNLKGLAFGQFTRCSAPNSPTIESVLQDFVSSELAGLSYPVITGLEVGHEGNNVALPIGCRARINNGVLSLVESPITES